MSRSRYCIGIDLGTSTCALAFLDTLDLKSGVRVMALKQWSDSTSVVKSDTLPSFVYLPPKSAWKKGACNLPGSGSSEPVSWVTGLMAKNQAVLTPDRVVHAAKSWLCHRGINAREPLLPWHSESLVGDEKISPVRASALCLSHLKELWDGENPDDPFCDQQITITVPASFNELASSLTLEAAREAGFPENRLRLLEEPQAAFYYHLFGEGRGGSTGLYPDHWDDISRQSQAQLCNSVKNAKTEGDKRPLVLVCDMGGGTTDFSLLEIEETQGELQAKRVAVSEHILLGGDNIDLKIAYTLERKIHQNGGPKKLDHQRWPALIARSRHLKEKVLGTQTGSAGEEFPVALGGSGSSLISGGLSTSLSRKELHDLILEGFFPLVGPGERPETGGHSTGIREWGLPYAQDSAVTRHLAEFLDGRKVSAVLFTGGSLRPGFLRKRILSQLALWQGEEPLELGNDSMELAVASGAAWAGGAGFFKSGKITGGYPRNLFVEVQKPGGERPLLCLLPRGFDSPNPVRISGAGLQVRLNEPVSFVVRYQKEGTFEPGSLVEDWHGQAGFRTVACVQALLSPRKSSGRGSAEPVAIDLEAGLSETGLLTLSCLPQDEDSPYAGEVWQLRFNVQERGVSRKGASLAPEPAAEVNEASLAVARQQIGLYFGKAKKGALNSQPARLVRELEQCLQLEKENWNTGLLRSLWDPLSQGETRRSRSEAHEAAWLNLSGYALRPGYGSPLDSFRTQELWKSHSKGMSFPDSAQVKAQWWIMWRRVAGGLTREQQEILFARIFPSVRKDTATPEMLLLSGSLELISMTLKIRLGQCLTGLLQNRRSSYTEQKVWALSRLASRVPLYGGPENVVRPAKIREWSEELDRLSDTHPAWKSLKSFYSQAGRMLSDRELDLEDQLRSCFLERLTRLNAPQEMIRVVRGYVPMDRNSHQQLFGENLPAGLTLMDG